MLLPSLLLVPSLLGAPLLTPVADSVPTFNIEPVCQGIAVQGGMSYRDTTIAQSKQDCITSEREVRAQLVKQWSTFSAIDKRDCVNESTMGGESSYTELLTCLEMARDVRKLGHEEDSSIPSVTPREK
jgi:uncharacterized protein (UPF0179 family)